LAAASFCETFEPHQRAPSPSRLGGTAGLASEYKNKIKSPYGRIPPKAGLQLAAGFFKNVQFCSSSRKAIPPWRDYPQKCPMYVKD